MRPCPHCAPYGGRPGFVPAVVPLSCAEWALPAGKSLNVLKTNSMTVGRRDDRFR
jgi:hypothetical protein